MLLACIQTRNIHERLCCKRLIAHSCHLVSQFDIYIELRFQTIDCEIWSHDEQVTTFRMPILQRLLYHLDKGRTQPCPTFVESALKAYIPLAVIKSKLARYASGGIMG